MTHVIAGARCLVEDPEAVLARARAWAHDHQVDVVLADAKVVFGRDHVESAIFHAARAQREDTMGTRTLGMETLLYLSTRRQVTDAIRVAGIHNDTTAAAIVVLGDASIDELIGSLGWTRDDDVLEPAGKSLEALGISREEERTIPEDRRTDLILERVAFVDLLK